MSNQTNKKMNKLIDTDNSVVVTRGKEGLGKYKEGKGGQIYSD